MKGKGGRGEGERREERAEGLEEGREEQEEETSLDSQHELGEGVGGGEVEHVGDAREAGDAMKGPLGEGSG